MESLCEVISKGTTPAGGNKAYLPHGITFIRAENITSEGQLRIDNTKHISEQQHFSELSRSILKSGDLLITIAGSLGRSAIFIQKLCPLIQTKPLLLHGLLILNCHHFCTLQ